MSLRSYDSRSKNASQDDNFAGVLHLAALAALAELAVRVKTATDVQVVAPFPRSGGEGLLVSANPAPPDRFIRG
jgi:hypothetical protein